VIVVLPSISARGFLGTGATFGADLNFVVQLAMGMALLTGALLARHKRYRAHGICQSTVLLLNLLMIALIMGPSLLQQVPPSFPKVIHKWYYRVATIHASLGVVAQLLGMYIVISAGTNLLPARFRLTRWKMWMRAELLLWQVVLLCGLATYCAWYLAPFR
jgi:uncharacterized membrane protein YozB (DUF420 family)